GCVPNGNVDLVFKAHGGQAAAGVDPLGEQGQGEHGGHSEGHGTQTHSKERRCRVHIPPCLGSGQDHCWQGQPQHCLWR
ncbi:unnamed protein product, partial [Choristocarpus tenellus]